MHQVQTQAEKLTVADLVTLSRFALAAAVAMTAGAGGPPWLIGVLAGTALFTDFVDGKLARATGTVTRLGARLDAEADALLILVLSVIVATDLGWWVLGLGLARYVFGVAFLVVPALSAPVASRPWCRIVAAVVGIVLAAVAALPLPGLIARGAVALVAVLLAESFLHEAVDRWRAPRAPVSVPFGSVAALGVVWAALAVPTAAQGMTAHTLLRVPVELVLVIGVALVPARRFRTVIAALAGLLLGVLVLVTVLNVSFGVAFDRDFSPVGDWSYLGPGVDVLGDSIGVGWARMVAALAGLAALGVLIGASVAVVWLVRAVGEQRRVSVRAATVLGTIGLFGAVVGAPVVSTAAGQLAVHEVRLVRADIADHREFARALAADPQAARAESDPTSLVAGLAGKDVLLVFVESYGRVAVQDTTYSRGIARILAAGTRQLTAAGYETRSAFVTSPTFGGASWLAHSTLQSGLWVDSESRYRQLLGARRITLTSLFGAAGWHTVFDVPANKGDWSEGAVFYGFDQYYDSRNVGYAGPRFGYAPVPDQYTLAHFRRAQLAPTDRKPVMAEIDLVSSHHPWTPLPRMVPWDQLGDGSIYAEARAQGPSEGSLGDAATVRERYGESIEYSWQALTSFLTTYPDPNLVLVVLGDHQPHSYVSGEDAGHDVPVSVIAQDPAVLRRIADWGWQPGLHPSPDATVWRMDTFRDRFLQAFSR